MGPLSDDYYTNNNIPTTPSPSPSPSTLMAASLLHLPGEVTTTTILAAGSPSLSSWGSTTTTDQATPLEDHANDHYGAMVFIVATVSVYALSIVFFIAGHTQKRVVNKDEERQISGYLKRIHEGEASKDARKFQVIKLKTQLLADSALGQRHNRRVSLIPRPLEVWKRLALEEEEEEKKRKEEKDGCQNGSSDDDDDSDDLQAERKAFRALLNSECSVQNVSEVATPAPEAPFRGRRFGCVGFHGGPFVGSGDRFHDGYVNRGITASSQHPPLFSHPLPDIQEDAVSLSSANADVSSSEEERDPSQSESPTPVVEDPHDQPRSPSSWIAQASSTAGRTDTVSRSSGSTQELREEKTGDTVSRSSGSTQELREEETGAQRDSLESLQHTEEQMLNGSYGSVIVTRL